MALGRAYPGGMQISYNGDVVGDASTLNFVSAAGEISVAYDPSDTSQINAYHPGATFASNWTLNDGIFGSGVVPSTPISTRIISTPTSEGAPFSTGGTAGTSFSASKATTITFAPLGDIRFADLVSTFTVSLDVGGTTLFNETTAVIAGNGSFTLPNLGSVLVTNFGVNTSEFKGNVSVAVPLSILVPNSGLVLIRIRHNNGGVNNQFQQSFFYDSESNVATQGTPTLALESEVVVKTSGVTALTTGTVWAVTVPDLDYVFADTAPISLLGVDSSAIGVVNYSVPSASLGSTAFDAVGLAYSESITINILGMGTCGGVTFTSALSDWSTGAAVPSNTLQALILTKAAASDLVETFGDEVFRVSPALGAWDSSALIATSDLVVACGKLQRRNKDYSTFLPHGVNAIVNPNYSTGDASQTYYRTFSDLGTSRQNATLVLEGLVSEAGIAIDFSVNGTDWFDLKSMYAGGTIQPGQGAKVSGSGNTYDFTLSSHNTAASGRIILRITMTTAHELTGLTLTWSS